MNRGVETVPVHRVTRLEKTVADVVIAADKRKILKVQTEPVNIYNEINITKNFYNQNNQNLSVISQKMLDLFYLINFVITVHLFVRLK